MEWISLDWINHKYQVSSNGEVRSYMRGTPKLLSPTLDRDGYVRIELSVPNKKAQKFYVHRLVLQAFTDSDGKQCNHKDGNKVNNTVDNLEWCTASENMLHAFRVLGRRHPRPNLGKFGVLHPKSRGVTQLHKDGTVVQVWGSISEVVGQGFSRQCVTHVCNGRQHTHKGFKWQYVN